MSVELRHLRALVAIHDEGTITDAAIALGVGQPALSRCLEQLETLVGVRLVERTTRQLAFTERGEQLYERARRLLDSVHDAVSEVTERPRPLRVGFGWGGLGALTTPLLRSWQAANTAQPVEVLYRDDPETALRRGEVDVAFLRAQPAAASGLALLALYEEPRLAVVPRDHVLADRPAVRLADLAAYPVLMCSSAGTTTPELWPEAIRPHTRTVTNNAEWLTTISIGDAVGVTALGSQQGDPPDGVTYLPIGDAPPVVVHLAWDVNASHPALGRWRDHTLAELRSRDTTDVVNSTSRGGSRQTV